MDYGIDRPAELAVEATARPAAKNYTLGDGLFALFCLAAGYMGVRWYFFGSYGIGTTLLFFTLGVGISVYLRGKGCALGRAYWAGILLLLGFGTVFSLFRPSFATFCTAVFLLLLLTLWAYRTAMDDGKGLIRRHWPADQARAFLVMPFASFGAAAGSFGGLFRRVPAGKRTKRVALGLLIAIPVTAATGVLLFQADAAFAGLLTTVWDTLFGGFELNIFRSVMRAALAVPGAFLLFSAVYSGRSRCCPTAFTDEGMDETRRQLRVMPLHGGGGSHDAGVPAVSRVFRVPVGVFFVGVSKPAAGGVHLRRLRAAGVFRAVRGGGAQPDAHRAAAAVQPAGRGHRQKAGSGAGVHGNPGGVHPGAYCHGAAQDAAVHRWVWADGAAGVHPTGRAWLRH